MNRIKAMTELLKRQGLDALLLTGAVNRFYATGLQSSAGAFLALPEESVFLTDFRYIEMARAGAEGFSVSMVSADSPLRRQVADRLGSRRRIGYESDSMTCRELAQWQESLPAAEFVPAETAVRALRAVKDAGELVAMKTAQEIAERALEELLDGVLRVGMTEREAAAELVYRMLRNGAERMSFEPIVVSGPNSSMPHGVPSDRRLEEGDFVTMDFGCVWGGYCSDMTRTVAMGHATDEMRSVYRIVLDAQAAGIAAARGGVVGAEIDRAARDVITAAGYGAYFGHGFGHGLGLEVHETPNANASETGVLPVGAVISAEPGIYLPGRFGVRIEDVVVLTPNGCDNLMKAPKELLIV